MPYPGLSWESPDAIGKQNILLKKVLDIIGRALLLSPSTVGTSPVTGSGAVVMSSANTLVLADTTSGPVTLTLPSAVGVAGFRLLVKVVAGVDNVTLTPSGTETVDGFVSAVFATEIELVAVAGGWIEL